MLLTNRAQTHTDIALKGVVSQDATLGWQPQDLLPLSSLYSSMSVVCVGLGGRVIVCV